MVIGIDRVSPVVPLEAVIGDPMGFRSLAGVSIDQMRRAERLCRERPGYRGDFLLALAWIDAESLAVNVRGDRAAWNDRMAAGRVDGLFGNVDFSAFEGSGGSRPSLRK